MLASLSGAALSAWLTAFCVDEVRERPLCKVKLNETMLQRCAEDLVRNSLWPSDEESSEVGRWFSNTSTLFIGDSTVDQDALYLKQHQRVADACAAKGTPGVCLARCGAKGLPSCSKSPCAFEHATSRRDFGLVVYNTGLHHLHLRPSRTPDRPRAFLEYVDMLRTCLATVRSAFPRAALVYRMTNDVCESRYVGPYKRDAAAWATRTEEEGYNMQFTAIGASSLHVAERAVASELEVPIIDPRVAGHCDCTGPGDGRHFAPLIPQYVSRLRSLHGRHVREERAPNRSSGALDSSAETHANATRSRRNATGTRRRAPRGSSRVSNL